MDWQAAITRNQAALLTIVIALMRSLGLSKGGGLTTLPFHLYHKALKIIRPVEAAVRRLIIIAAHDLALRGITVSNPRPAAVPICPLFAKRRGPSGADVEPQQSSFLLVEPLKTFDTDLPDFASFGPSFADETTAARIPAAGLGARLLALYNALNSIEKQARRLTRWYAQRDAALKLNQPHRMTIIRPGPPPSQRARPRHEAQIVLNECHGLARYIQEGAATQKPDSS